MQPGKVPILYWGSSTLSVVCWLDGNLTLWDLNLIRGRRASLPSRPPVCRFSCGTAITGAQVHGQRVFITTLGKILGALFVFIQSFAFVKRKLWWPWFSNGGVHQI